VAAKRREGFERLLGAVALGEVGLILSRELSRLLRTDKDFCQLVEVCQLFGTLVGDEHTIYDVSRLDDQLVLGKGLLAGLLRCGRCGRKLYVRYWGKSGTSARYLCSGDFTSGGGRYCVGFGGATVDRRVGEEIARVLSPLGIQASLQALHRGDSQEDERRHALLRQIEQLDCEAARSWEQYNAVDPRNRLVASELERRWKAKLQELECARGQLNDLDQQRKRVTAEERHALLAFGERFADVWYHAACPIELKKQIVRSVIEEIVVDERPPGRLSFVVHWKGGCHTAFEMEKASPKTVNRTTEADLDVIRKTAPSYGDDEIARVLNKLGRRTGKGHPWSKLAVKTARCKHGIDGYARSVADPEISTLKGRKFSILVVSRVPSPHFRQKGAADISAATVLLKPFYRNRSESR
jgi:hypothetical protein